MSASVGARDWVPAAIGAGAVVLASLIPVVAGQALFAPLTLGLLVALAGSGGLALAFAAAVTSRADRQGLAPCLEAVALCAGCGLAMLCAAASVAATAETLDLENVVLAQANTSLYVIKQPLAVWIYLVALALAAHESVLAALVGPPARARATAMVLMTVAFSALGATLFLGGFVGTGAPGPVWLAAKTLVVALALVLLRRALRDVARDARMSIAWAAAIAGMLNLAVSFVQMLRE